MLTTKADYEPLNRYIRLQSLHDKAKGVTGCLIETV